MGRLGLRDFMNENEAYAECVEEINKKLALREAIDAANRAIASSKNPQPWTKAP